MTVRPDKRQNTDEIGAAVIAASGGKRAVHLLHGHDEVAVWPGPAGRIDPRRAVQHRHHQPGIIGKRRLAGGVHGGPRLQQRIAGKTVLGFLRFRNVMLARRGHSERATLEQGCDLAKLAGIVRGQDKLALGEGAMRGRGHRNTPSRGYIAARTASACNVNRCRHPASARSSMRVSSSRRNGRSSPVA